MMADAREAAGKTYTHIIYDGANHGVRGRSQAMRDTKTDDDDDYDYAYKAMMGEAETFLENCFASDG